MRINVKPIFYTILLSLIFSTSYSAVPHYINYTGKLSDPNTGQPLIGNYNITFSLYNVSSGGVAIWTEVQSVTVTSGFFSVLLGEGSSGIPTDVFSPSGDRYLEVQIDASPPMTPRQKLVSTAYAFEAQVADSARWAEANDWGDHALAGYLTAETDPDFNDSVAAQITEVDTTNWNEAYNWGNHQDAGYMSSESDPQVGSNTTSMVPRWNGSALVAGSIFDDGNNIGIGTSTPAYKLDINGNSRVIGDLSVTGNDIFGGSSNLKLSPGNGYLEVKPSISSNGLVLREYNSNDYGNFVVSSTGLGIGYNTTAHITINGSGYVGINTTAPTNRLHVNGGIRAEGPISTGHTLTMDDVNGTARIITAADGGINLFVDSDNNASDSNGAFVIWANAGDLAGGNVRLLALWQNGNMDVTGTITRSGREFATMFGTVNIDLFSIGDVVMVDPDNTDQILKSSSAYNRTVVGIVSDKNKAGYIAGFQEDDKQALPIALVGKTLCNVTDENGPIKIGDLLTTSSTPGHAMRVDDYLKAAGAILGKALESFDGNSGQILVLVTLQ